MSTEIAIVIAALIIGFGVRGMMKPWEAIEHILEDDPPAVRRVSNIWGWLIAALVVWVVFTIISSGKIGEVMF